MCEWSTELGLCEEKSKETLWAPNWGGGAGGRRRGGRGESSAGKRVADLPEGISGSERRG